MPVKVRIPTPLRSLTAGQSVVEVGAKDINELIRELEKTFPGFKERICDEGGQIRRFVNIYVNEEDIRFKEGQSTLLKEGDDVSIVPAIAGGCGTPPPEPFWSKKGEI